MGKRTIRIMERAQSASVRTTKTMISLKMASVDHLEVRVPGEAMGRLPLLPWLKLLLIERGLWKRRRVAGRSVGLVQQQ